MVLLSPASSLLAGGVYQSPEAFLDDVFGSNTPSAETLWLKGDIKETATRIMGHRYAGLRIRYWREAERTTWILEEIGKEKPITVGLVINQDRIERIKVLEFRESRGWEVRHPFFTDQFKDATLDADQKLSQSIDGISGATLSVRALKKLARLALYLHSQATKNDTP